MDNNSYFPLYIYVYIYLYTGAIVRDQSAKMSLEFSNITVITPRPGNEINYRLQRFDMQPPEEYVIRGYINNTVLALHVARAMMWREGHI